MNHNTIVRGLQILTHIGLVAGFFIQPSLLIFSVLIYWFIGVIGINIGYHRLISHRSFETYKPIEWFLALVGCVTTVGSPLAWSALHRQHHQHAETEKDPHSPHQIGWWRAWFGFWKVQNINVMLARDLRKIPFYQWTHKYYLLIILSYVAIIGLFAGPVWIIYAYAVPAVLVLHSTSAIIVIAHIHGYKTHKVDDESRNSWIASLITLGEGWHNNHHANSRNWKQGEKWWELDPPAWIIGAIKK